MALVAGAEFQNRCDIYCNDFGHRAVFAARAVPGSCFPQARYGISEHIPSDVMLCQCVIAARQLASVADDKHAVLPAASVQLERMVDPLSDFVSHPSRRLQTSNRCVHDEPYVVQIFTSNQTGAGGQVPVVFFDIGGQQGQLIRLRPRFPTEGQMVQTEPLFLALRPKRFGLLGAGADGPYGYRRIQLVRGAETTVILDSVDGAPLGNNDFWISGSVSGTEVLQLGVRTEQVFDIPSQGNFSSNNLTTTTSREPGTFTLEFVTSGQFAGGMSGFVVIVEVFRQGEPQSIALPIIDPVTRPAVGAFSCIRQNLLTRPLNLTLRASGSIGRWSYSSIYFVSDAGPVPLISSLNAAGVGLNNFWVGTDPLTRRQQTFAIPSNPTPTTITVATTSRPFCVHDEPYIIQISRSTQLGPAGSITGQVPEVSLFVSGDGFMGPIYLYPRNPGLGETVVSAPLFIPRRPTRLQLRGISVFFGYRRISLLHGGETTVVLDSDNGLPFGNNSFWIRGERTPAGSPPSVTALRFQQEFEVPSGGDISSTTLSTTTASRGLDMFTLEMVTSPVASELDSMSKDGGSRLNGLSSLTIDAFFEVPTATGNQQIVAQILPSSIRPGIFECIAVTLSSVHRPLSLALQASVTIGSFGAVYGYSSIYLIDNTGLVDVVYSPFGAAQGFNDFWIGTTGTVRRMQNFSIPTIPTISTTSTSTPSSTHTVTIPQRLQCPPYTAWQNLLGVPCGNCEALVEAAPYSGSCELYCSSIGLDCITAWDDVDGTCSRRNQVDCSTPVPNAGLGMLCTCQQGTLAPFPQQCNAYAQWAQINMHICGGCKASAALNVPSLAPSSTCFDYCKSFGHRCTAAAVQGSTPCSSAQVLNCTDTVQAELEVLCTCQQ